jgi:hypothetical protein
MTQETEVIDGGSVEVTSNGGGGKSEELKSLFEQVADLREEAKKDHWLDLPIPALDNLVWVRYRPFPAAKTEQKQAELQRISERGGAIMLRASCDTLVDACAQIMVLPPKFDGNIGPKGENLVPIDDEIPVQFEQRLVELFVKNPEERAGIKTARDVVLAMFPTEQAVIAQNVEVSRWMQDVTRKSDSDLLGN